MSKPLTMVARCAFGHNRKFTYKLGEVLGCVACERDDLSNRVFALEAALAAAEAALADERRHALDMWYLAAGLHDDDTYYGNNRKAPERLARAGEAMGWPDGTRQFYVDVTGYEPEEAARRAAEVE